MNDEADYPFWEEKNEGFAAFSPACDIAVAPIEGDTAKRALSALLAQTGAELAPIGYESGQVATLLFAAFARQMLELHSHLPAYGSAYPGREREISPGEMLTEANLGAYCQDRFSDPSARAIDIVTLPGGFGKQTVLFTLTLETFTADLVIRRDPPIDPLDRRDCHSAAKEYPLLKAVNARGFPAPEPICFEAASGLIAGPAFTVMRRAPGSVAGDAAGGSGQIAPALQQALAGIVARQHDVAPLTELSDNPVFAARLCNSSASAATHAYI